MARLGIQRHFGSQRWNVFTVLLRQRWRTGPRGPLREDEHAGHTHSDAEAPAHLRSAWGSPAARASSVSLERARADRHSIHVPQDAPRPEQPRRRPPRPLLRPVPEPLRERRQVGARSPHMGSPRSTARPRVEPALAGATRQLDPSVALPWRLPVIPPVIPTHPLGWAANNRLARIGRHIASVQISLPAAPAPRRLDHESRAWLAQLRSAGPVREAAIERLHAVPPRL